MHSSLQMGQYIPVDSPAHRWDARSKIAATAGLGASLIIAPDWPHLLAVLLFSMAIVCMSHISIRTYLGGLRFLLILVTVTACLQALIMPGQILWDLGWLRVTREGLTSGSQLLLRLTGVLLLAAWLTHTTRPVELTAGLERLLSPLKRLKFPVHELVMIMTLSMRFLPLLVEETLRVQRAQLARGADWSRGSPAQRIQRITAVIVPLLRLSLERAVELAEAMENRGYRGGQGMTGLAPRRLQLRDYLLLAAVGLALLSQFIV